jgi:hypothetical protein
MARRGTSLLLPLRECLLASIAEGHCRRARRGARSWCKNVVLPARRMPSTAVALPGNITGPKTRRAVALRVGVAAASATKLRRRS